MLTRGYSEIYYHIDEKLSLSIFQVIIGNNPHCERFVCLFVCLQLVSFASCLMFDRRSIKDRRRKEGEAELLRTLLTKEMEFQMTEKQCNPPTNLKSLIYLRKLPFTSNNTMSQLKIMIIFNKQFSVAFIILFSAPKSQH